MAMELLSFSEPSCNNRDGIDGRLVHPSEPRTVRVSMRATF
jgi:hypothetical protein